MTQTFQTGYKQYLTKKLEPADTTVYVNVAPTVTKGRMYLTNGQQEERISYTGVSGLTLTGCTRTLSETADPATGGTGLTRLAGTPIALVAMHDQLDDKQEASTITGAKTFSGAMTINNSLTVAGTTSYVKYPELTTTQRLALTPANGMVVYDSTLGENYQYLAGARSAFSAGSTQPNASTTVAGKVEAPTQTEVEQLGTTGGTGALVFVTPTTINPNSITGATPAEGDKVSFSDASDNNYLKSTTYGGIADALGIYRNHFGTGADGAISGGLTITGSNDTYILKQYTTFTPGANTVTITPTNCIVHIKVQGNCDLTGTTFTFTGKGGSAGIAGSGGGGATVSGGDGSDGNGTTNRIGGGTGGGATFTNKAPLYAINYATNMLQAGCGGGGGGGQYDSDVVGTAGAGGAGGGCLILEVGGNLTFSGTTMNFGGANGGTSASHGGGGGGGGGCIVIQYKGTLSGSPTTTITGGSAGSGSTFAGGQGGCSLITTGASGGTGGGGAGGVGIYYIAQVV